ncbi:MAG: thiamine pyrophosphate-dependent enzyme [Methylobacter sp.]|nr:thiamine pyrophosphate-dependent enzyme [Methylobacter sp.]
MERFIGWVSQYVGVGVAYAIAAKFAYPERVAIALVGDGAM